jgi:ATP-dependent DNA helicase RecG
LLDGNFLDLDERIGLAIRVGESQFREFKSAYEGVPGEKVPRKLRAVAEDIGRTLVAFANADGGELLIGVEDDGSVTGVPFSPDDLQRLLNASESHVHTDTPLPSPRKATVRVGSLQVAYFAVAKGTQFVHLTSDGRCLKRIDRDSVPVSAEHISAHRLEDQARGWDRAIATGATLADLDLDLINSVASQIAYGISPEKCLQYLDLAEFTPEGLRVKNAGVVLFAKDIRRWHPRCQVRLLWVTGQERLSGEAFNVDREDIVADNVLRLVDSAWERLTVALAHATRLTSEARFEQTLLYPQIACREALINAIVHRNYAIEGRGIEVTLFSDRLEIASPGMLLSTVSLDDLRAQTGVHESRNPLVARVLREVGFVREMGEGVRRIYEVMRSNALAEPTLCSDTTGFTVSLSNRSLYPDQVRLWLSNFDEFNLTEAQRGVLALGYGGREFSTQEIIDRLGIVDTDKVREVTAPLRALGLIERTANHMKLFKQAARRRVPKREVPSYRVADLADTQSPRKLVNAPTPREMKGDVGDDEEYPADEAELFVGNLPFSVTKEDLVGSLVELGYGVVSLALPAPNVPGRSNRGYAFVRVTTSGRPMSEVLSRLDGVQIDGRRLVVQLPRRTS